MTFLSLEKVMWYFLYLEYLLRNLYTSNKLRVPFILGISYVTFLYLEYIIWHLYTYNNFRDILILEISYVTRQQLEEITWHYFWNKLCDTFVFEILARYFVLGISWMTPQWCFYISMLYLKTFLCWEKVTWLQWLFL